MFGPRVGATDGPGAGPRLVSCRMRCFAIWLYLQLINCDKHNLSEAYCSKDVASNDYPQDNKGNQCSKLYSGQANGFGRSPSVSLSQPAGAPLLPRKP